VSNVLAQAIASQKDAILYELFNAHGYTRTKVKKLVAKNRIDMLVEGNVETYRVDGKELFSLEKTVKFDDEAHNVTFTFKEVTDNE
jgi:threonine synthase